jgi:hypothetical protein
MLLLLNMRIFILKKWLPVTKDNPVTGSASYGARTPGVGAE